MSRDTWSIATSLFQWPLQIITAIALAPFLCLSFILIYRSALHPLAGIPGPRLAAISNLWYAFQARNGRMFELGRSLHEEYGPMVRVGPNEVWFNSKEAFRAIYGAGSGFEKSDFYLATIATRPELDRLLRPIFPDTLDLLSERSMSRYRLQRRLIGPIYQTSSLSRYTPAVDSVLDRTVEKLKSLQGEQVELKEWMHIIAVECLASVVLSWSPGLLQAGTDFGTSTHSYQGWRKKSVFGLFPLIAKAEIYSSRLGMWFTRCLGVAFQRPENFKAFFPEFTKRINKRIKAATQPIKHKDTRTDLMADLIQLHKDKLEFTLQYMKRMAMTNFGAGHETLASTLTSIISLAGSHQRVQETLKEALQKKEHDYLQAVIKESKRLRPVISMSLPRTVPEVGFRLAGQFFPPGTIVGCNPVALHRNPDICGPEPEKFNPDRWFDGERARIMERYSLAWGGGARSCPGRHLAELIVDRVVARLFEEFKIEVDLPEKEGESYFLSIRTGVKVRFLAEGL